MRVRLGKDLPSKMVRLVLVTTVAMLLIVNGNSQEILTSVDSRSLKGRVDPSKNSPLLVAIEKGSFRFRGVSLTRNALMAILNDQMDQRTRDNRVIVLTTADDTTFTEV